MTVSVVVLDRGLGILFVLTNNISSQLKTSYPPIDKKFTSKSYPLGLIQ